MCVSNRMESIVEEEGSNDINERKEGETNGRGVGDLREDDELDATIDVIVCFLELKLILVGNNTVYRNSPSMSY